MVENVDVDSLSATNAPFVVNFSYALAELLKEQYRLRFSDISSEQLAQEVQTVMDAVLPNRVTLSGSRPDYENNLMRLMREIEKGDAWKDTTLASTGQMILRIIAADIDLAQFAIMRALQETFPHTARNPTSIIAAARGHGIKVQRNLPGRVEVKFTRQDVGVLQVPRWTQFVVDETAFFNREQINFGPNDISMTVTLHEGRVREATVNSSGVSMQIIEVGDETHNISDADIRVFVNNVEWKRSEASIWNADSDAQLFWENTLPNGNVEVRFGDGIWGASPPPGVPIKVMWVETIGADSADPRSDLEVRWVGGPSGIILLGETIGPVTAGNNRLSINYYRTFSGDRRGADGGSQKRAVLRKDFRAHAATFPGVFDAIFRGQAELNPNKRSWMNILGVTLLTDPVFTQNQWEDFVRFMRGGGEYEGLMLDNLELLRMDPTPVALNVKAKVYCRINADLNSVKARLTQNLIEATRPRIGMLGFSFYKSDIYELLKGTPPAQLFGDLDMPDPNGWRSDLPSLIEYVILETPDGDIVLDNALQWVKLGTVDLEVVYSKQRRGGFEGHIPGTLANE